MRGRLRWEWEAVKRGRIYCASCFFAFLPFCSARFQAKIFTASFQHELPGQKRRDTKEFWPRRQTHKTFCVVTSEETKSCSIFNILRHRPWQTIDGRWNRSRHAGKRFQPFSEYSICSFIQPQTEMQKAADAADISVLFFSAGANFWAILGHFWAILAILGHFWANLYNFGSFLGYFG